MNKILFPFALIILILSTVTAADNLGEIELNIIVFENSTGRTRILLFSSIEENAFPSEHKKSYKKIIVPITNNKVIYTFENIPFGVYAISVHHDQDGDGEVDTNWFGIPNEGLGASNDAKGTFGPPSFEDASFKLNKKKIRLTINMVY